MSHPALTGLAVRVAAVGLVVTGLELLAVAREMARWRPRGSGATRVGWWRAGAGLLVAAAIGFASWPPLCTRGGGVVAAGVLGAFVLAGQPMGDGADVMLVIVLAGLGLTAVGGEPGPVRAVVRWTLVADVVVAYVWSGAAKLAVPAWRAGRQVALIVNSPRYGSRGLARILLGHPSAARALAWPTIALEVTCPVAVALGGWWLIGWAVAAALMHAAIAVVMGLGRFLWAFGAGLTCLLAVRGV